MRLFHHAWITVYAKPEDNFQRVKETLVKLFPFNLKEEKLKVEETIADIDEIRKFSILQVHLEKAHHLNAFLKSLLSKLTPEQKAILNKQKESRLDSALHFFIRLDKPNLMELGEHWLTDAGNCFHIKFLLAAYPATRKAGLKLIDTLFSQDLKEGED
ncbi:MAG: RNA-binding domain-containing protein [Nanoarchaeota archaeon]|nr:RNA-binding domain-containing protein [Nanoarchaeota archaeon]